MRSVFHDTHKTLFLTRHCRQCTLNSHARMIYFTKFAKVSTKERLVIV